MAGGFLRAPLGELDIGKLLERLRQGDRALEQRREFLGE
jgi:hypothetical protein